MRVSNKVIFSSMGLLIILNILLLYLLEVSIGISDTLEHADNDQIIKQLENKEVFIEIIADLIFIIDLTVILLVIFLFFKGLMKITNRIFFKLSNKKTSISQHQTPSNL